MTKSTITRERLQELAEGQSGFNLRTATHEESQELARMALAAMDSESGCLPLDYLQGHKDGLEWAAQLAEANHPETGDWLYDDPIELAKAIRKGPDMPPAQPVADSEPVIVVGDDGGDALSYRRLIQSFEPGTKLYRHAQPAPVVPEDFDFNRFNDVVWLECVASNPHMHSPTTSAIARVALELNKRSATMEAEPDRNPVLAYADSYRDMAKQGVESVPIWSVITDLERNIAPLYRHAQPASVVQEVDADDNFYSWFGREWRENYQHNQYTTAAKQMLGVIAESAWKAGCRAAMLAAAPQSPGSEPATVPGKWIPVSERMPIEFEAVIAFDGDQVYGEAMHSSDDGFTIDGYDPCDRVQLQNVTHWMPLPAGPQGVKGE